MSHRAKERQEDLWTHTANLPRTPGDPFYARLNDLLKEADFDRKVEKLCEPFYAKGKGLPSIAPGTYMPQRSPQKRPVVVTSKPTS